MWWGQLRRHGEYGARGGVSLLFRAEGQTPPLALPPLSLIIATTVLQPGRAYQRHQVSMQFQLFLPVRYFCCNLSFNSLAPWTSDLVAIGQGAYSTVYRGELLYPTVQW